MGKKGFWDRIKNRSKKREGQPMRLPPGYTHRWYQDQDFLAHAEHVYGPETVKGAMECESREDVERFMKRQAMEVAHSSYRAGRQCERYDILESLRIYLPKVGVAQDWLESFVAHVLDNGRYVGLARRAAAGETVEFDDADTEAQPIARDEDA